MEITIPDEYAAFFVYFALFVLAFGFRVAAGFVKGNGSVKKKKKPKVDGTWTGSTMEQEPELDKGSQVIYFIFKGISILLIVFLLLTWWFKWI